MNTELTKRQIHDAIVENHSDKADLALLHAKLTGKTELLSSIMEYTEREIEKAMDDLGWN